MGLFHIRGGELVKRYGRQTPTFERVGSYDHSDGPDAVALFEGYGVRKKRVCRTII